MLIDLRELIFKRGLGEAAFYLNLKKFISNTLKEVKLYIHHIKIIQLINNIKSWKKFHLTDNPFLHVPLVSHG